MLRSSAGATLAASEPRRYTRPSFAERERWDAENNIVRRFAFFATLAMLFLKFSSIHEFLMASIGHGIPVMYVVMPPATLGMLFSGGLKRTLRSKTAWWWLAFAAWIVIGIPLSSWVGGSLRVFYTFIRTELLMLFLIAGTVTTWKECRTVFTCVAFAALIPIFFSFRHSASGDRLGLDFDGSIANPNYLAAHLLLVLAFCLFVILHPKIPFLFRMIMGGTAAIGLYAILRTGSRGAMLALAVCVVVFLLRSSTRQRLIAAAAAPVAIAGALFFIPSETLTRLKSFSAGEDSRLEAVQSSQSREYLFKKSIEFTLQNPAFGLGMGQFSTVEGFTSRANGERGNWHETHNAFTQVSSECGIPAMLFFVAAIAGTLRLFHKLSKRAKAVGHTEILLAANCAVVGMAGFTFAILFLSLAYVFYLPFLTGLAIAMHATTERELNQAALRWGGAPGQRR